MNKTNVREVTLKYSQCVRCHNVVRVGLWRCPECGTWLFWNGDQSEEINRRPPTGNIWGKVNFHGLPQVSAVNAAGEEVRKLIPDARVYVVAVKGDYYLLDEGMVHYRHLLISRRQFAHGRINAAATGFSSIHTPYWNPDESKLIRDLTPTTRVEIFDRQDDYLRVGDYEWVWQGFIDPVISVGTIIAKARGYFSTDTSGWDPNTSKTINALRPGLRVEVFQREGDALRIGPSEWIWKGFVKEEKAR